MDWHDGVVYQIYPRSFQDTDGDGVGDLPGIAARLDHLADLGVDALWLSPIYPSPLADFGYDVSDHSAVDPRFGTLADLDALAAQSHERGLKLLLDSFRVTPRSSIHGFGSTQSGTCGPTPTVPPTTWSPRSEGRRDPATNARAAGTCTRFMPSNRTSIGTIPRSWRQCSGS